MDRYRQLPPLTMRELHAVQLVKKGGTACSSHLADLGLLPREEIKNNHEALRRVAKRRGIYEKNSWIGKLGQMIFNDPTLE